MLYTFKKMLDIGYFSCPERNRLEYWKIRKYNIQSHNHPHLFIQDEIKTGKINKTNFVYPEPKFISKTNISISLPLF